MESGTVVIQSFLALIRAMDGRGVDMGALLGAAGLRPDELKDLDMRVPITALYDVYEFVMHELDDPGLPMHIAQSLTIADLHVMGFAIETAPSIEVALRRSVRYVRLAFDAGIDWMFREHNEHITISYAAPMPPRLGVRIATEVALGQFIHHFRELSRQDVLCTQVRFPHARPRDDSAHRAFFRCELEYGQGACSFTFPRHFMDAGRAPGVDAALGAFFGRYAEELLKELPVRASVVESCTRAIERSLATGEPSAERVARSIGMSDRALRRALADESTSFRKILDDVRERRARAMLQTGEASMSDIAFLLGFGDSSAFSRAFKRWTGQSPREFRKSR